MTKPLTIQPETFTNLPLAQEAQALLSSLIDGTSGHSAKTLVKSPNLTLVLMALREGERLAEHTAPSAALVMAIEGSLRITHAEGGHDIASAGGDAVLMGPGLRHGVAAHTDCVLLLAIGAH